MTDPTEIVRRCFQAYVDDDRAALEQLIATDFAFTSPLDNRLDRSTYFKRCWPNIVAEERRVNAGLTAGFSFHPDDATSAKVVTVRGELNEERP